MGVAALHAANRPRVTRGAPWVVSRYADALAVLKDDRFSNDFTSKMPWTPRSTRALTHSMLKRDPPDHTRLRALIFRGLEELPVEFGATVPTRSGASPRPGGRT